jgi:hypothetical protein
MNRKRKNDFLCSSRTLQRRLKETVDSDLKNYSTITSVHYTPAISDDDIVEGEETVVLPSSQSHSRNSVFSESDVLPSSQSYSSVSEENDDSYYAAETDETPFNYDVDDDILYSDSDSDSDLTNEDKPDIRDLISIWARTCKTPLTHIGLLLDCLRVYFPDLPKDPRTILNTPRHSAINLLPSGGEYLHLGLETGLKNFLDNHSSFSDSVLNLQFNIDGLPMFRSSNLSLWPIQCLVKNVSKCSPFFVGVYSGKEKPKSLDEFLEQFISELSSLQTNGLQHCERHYMVAVHSFVCDAPARAFLKNTKLHSGYSSCEKCEQHGEYVGRVVFLKTDVALRTDAAFDEMIDDDHHCGSSPLVQLGIGMVSQFALDYMHLVCLGVVRRLLLYWKGPVGPLPVRLGFRSIETLSRVLLSFVAFIPCEFARKPRAVSEVLRWKATEFRQFLLYTGPVALKDVLLGNLYDHFIDLSVAIRILSTRDLASNFNDYANKLLIKFVQNAKIYYGRESCVYNVHNLIHLAGDVARFGPLDEFSCFPFENQLRHLKQLVKKPQHVLQQIHRRLTERHFSLQSTTSVPSVGIKHNSVHNRGPLCSSVHGEQVTQYSKLTTDSFQFTLQEGNNCFSTQHGNIYKLRNIVSTLDGTAFIICQQFVNLEDFFVTPLSSSSLGIYQTGDGQFMSKLIVLPIDCICNKYVCLPSTNGKKVLLPFV